MWAAYRSPRAYPGTRLVLVFVCVQTMILNYLFNAGLNIYFETEYPRKNEGSIKTPRHVISGLLVHPNSETTEKDDPAKSHPKWNHYDLRCPRSLLCVGPRRVFCRAVSHQPRLRWILVFFSSDQVVFAALPSIKMSFILRQVIIALHGTHCCDFGLIIITRDGFSSCLHGPWEDRFTFFRL